MPGESSCRLLLRLQDKTVRRTGYISVFLYFACAHPCAGRVDTTRTEYVNVRIVCRPLASRLIDATKKICATYC